jgi:hypothetical protein
MAEKDSQKTNRAILASIAFVALGVTFTTVFENLKAFGIVLTAIGGFLLIVALKRKKDDRQ